MSTRILGARTNDVNSYRQAWWIEIFTVQPQCTYYFGPFTGAQEAEVASIGFVEDLEGEFAQGINTKIDRHSQPALLTIEHDLIESTPAIEEFKPIIVESDRIIEDEQPIKVVEIHQPPTIKRTRRQPVAAVVDSNLA